MKCDSQFPFFCLHVAKYNTEKIPSLLDDDSNPSSLPSQSRSFTRTTDEFLHVVLDRGSIADLYRIVFHDSLRQLSQHHRLRTG